MTKQARLDRFHEAQEGRSFRLPNFNKAYKEIQDGRKTGHWIWYVFPQLKELGMSSTAKKYGLVDFQETCDYLQDPILFVNYNKIVQEVLFQLQYTSVKCLMGSSIDAKKLMSSLTLFREAADYLANEKQSSYAYRTLQKNCNLILARASEEQLLPCQDTLNLIKPYLQKSTEISLSKSSPIIVKEEIINPIISPPPKKQPPLLLLLAQTLSIILKIDVMNGAFTIIFWVLWRWFILFKTAFAGLITSIIKIAKLKLVLQVN